MYYSTTGTCSGDPPTEKAASSSSGSYTTTSGEMDVGTHYFYCSIGTHCASGMYVTVNVTKGNSAILNPSDVTYTATDINGATKAADWQTDCSWGGTGSCGASYCTDMSTKPKCDPNQLKFPNVAATSIDSAEELAKYTAQTCTQADSTVDERCGATWLNTRMSAGRLGTGGAVAAYCNDKYGGYFASTGRNILSGWYDCNRLRDERSDGIISKNGNDGNSFEDGRLSLHFVGYCPWFK